MRQKTLLFFTCATFLPLSMVLMSNWNGPQTTTSGSPLENGMNCTQCHGGTANSGSGNLTIDGPDEYEPGETYTITVDVNDESSSKFGFQAIAVDESNMVSGTFMTGTDQGTYKDGNNEYIQHNTPSSDGSFTFDWTAPASEAGTITLYAAGNASNSDNKVDGDMIYTNSHTMAVAGGTGIGHKQSDEISVFPNPSNGQFSVTFGNLVASNVRIYNLSGEVVYDEEVATATINIEGLNVGIYILKANTASGTYTKKLMVR